MKIENYRFGSIVVDGSSYSYDLIILPDKILPEWWRVQGHNLVPDDLRELLIAHPATVIIGTGAYGLMKVPEATVNFLRGQRIEPIILHTGEACSRFNELSMNQQTAAALHLTC